MAKMKHLTILVAAGFCTFALPASATTVFGLPVVAGIAAQNYTMVIAMLEDTGYRVTSMKSTLLGRLKIRAQNREHVREVVVSRSTGEIMSDRIVKVFNDPDGDRAVSREANAPQGGQEPSGASANVGGTSASVGSGGASVSTGGGSVSVGLGG